MRTLVLFMAVVLSACTAGDSGVAQTPLWNTAWIAETIAGKPVKPPGSVTLNFGDNQVSGNAGCNSYMGPVAISGDTVKFGSIASTMMACLEQGRMQQEMTFHDVLKSAVRIERPSVDSLEISTADGRKIALSRKR
jgi:heat shock protein HslJ